MILISKITATVQNKSTCFLFPFRWCSRLKLFSFFPLNFVKLEKRSSEAIKLEKFWFWEINLFKVSSEIQLFRFQVLLNWPLTSNCSIGLIQLHHSSYIWALRIRRWNGCGEWTSSNHRSFDRESCCSHHKSGKFWWSLCTLGWKDCVSFECCTRGKFELTLYGFSIVLSSPHSFSRSIISAFYERERNDQFSRRKPNRLGDDYVIESWEKFCYAPLEAVGSRCSELEKALTVMVQSLLLLCAIFSATCYALLHTADSIES